ncbi:MAG: hypothetical protein NT001_00090 [Candidatus Woesearchaeota archaeon]|nr:hypothetical protein [Candidatus Woesearchaeota archaeon]
MKEALFIILGFIFITLVFGWLLFGGNSNDKKDIEEKGQTLKNDAALNALLNTPVNSETLNQIDASFKKMTISELISRYFTETDQEKQKAYNDALEKRIVPLMDAAYGEGSWHIVVNMPFKVPAGSQLSFGSFSTLNVITRTERISSESFISSSDGNVIKNTLVTELK